GNLRPISIHPKGDKLTRMVAHTAILEAGYVHLPESAGWLPDFQTEMLLFPRGSHDDQVDSVSQFLTWVTQPQANPQIRFL
ncbi:MAG: phage terminase large subunit, partial [Proteobacteria bacterium]|nr:phage terminase large subunit [Pseudomonadota bacterium]